MKKQKIDDVNSEITLQNPAHLFKRALSALLETSVTNLTQDVRNSTIQRSIEPNFVQVTSKMVRVLIKSFAHLLTQNLSSKQICLKILTKIRTSICFISKQYGVLTQNLFISNLMKELTVSMLTTGKIFEEDLNCLSLILFFNVIIGDKMNSLNRQMTDAKIFINVPMLMGQKKFIIQPPTKRQPAVLELTARKFTAHFTTTSKKNESQFQKGSFTNQNLEVQINRRTFFSNNFFLTIKSYFKAFQQLCINHL